MNHNTKGIRNTSLGMISNFNNQTGNLNTSIGFAANYSNVSERNNVGIGKNNPDATLDINGDLKISGTNANLIIERGSNSLAGTVSLNETGAATIYNSKVTENSIIFLTSQNDSASGTLRVTNINSGVSFSIQANESFDFENSKIGYLIIN